MAKQYGTKHGQLKPAILSDASLLAIGKMIRAFAEIEDVITLHVCQLAQINESSGVMLLGKQSISTKLSLAIEMAKTIGGEAHGATKFSFENEVFTNMLRIRNVLAHSVFIGKTDDDELAFLTSTQSNTPGMYGSEVVTYKEDNIIAWAAAAELCLAQVQVHLKLEAFRKARFSQPFEPHPKAQPSKSSSAKHRR